MPTCPDPAALTFWRNVMAASGGTLILASLLLIEIAMRARISGWPLRLASGLSVAFAFSVAAASFVIRARLDGAAAQIARWLSLLSQRLHTRN